MKSAKKSMGCYQCSSEVGWFLPIYIGWFDINYRGWNKAEGLKLIETIGLKPEEVVCSDSENDLDLLKIAHHSCHSSNSRSAAVSVSAAWH